MKHLLACVGCQADSSYIIADGPGNCKENFTDRKKKVFYVISTRMCGKQLAKIGENG
jgi:hypothetical protein